jgi:VanZ family protein
MSETPLPIPNRRFYAWLALAFIGFVVYASWMPFNFQPLPADQAVARFREVLAGPLGMPSRSDWVANVLLMAPVGFFLAGALGADRPGPAVLGDAALVLPTCLLLSASVEFGQLFLPGRVCSLSDIAAQGVGALTGVAVWAAAGEKVTAWGRRFSRPGESAGWQARLLPAYLAALAAVYLLPLDFTLSPAAIYHKFKAGHVNFVPFALPAGAGYAYAEKTVLNVAYCGVLGLLVAGLPGRRRQRRGQAGVILLLAFLALGLLHGLKLLVASRSFDATDVVVGSLAVVAGWYLRVALPGRGGGSLWTKETLLRLRLCLLAAWLALVVFVTWQPFDFDFGLVRPRLGALTPVPFADAWRGQELLALENTVQKFVLYCPAGALLTTWRPGPRRLAWLPALLGGLLVALPLEAGQLALLSRTAMVSDVYTQTAGALVGGLITRRVCAQATSGPQGLAAPGGGPGRRGAERGREPIGQVS